MGRSDAELLEASKRGEREAFGALIERYQGVVCAVSYSRTGDRALSEDVAQDTFIAAWRQLDRLREPGRLRSWLCGISRNLARKARRRTSREAPLDRIVVFEGANPFDDAAEAESERVVRDALARVPEIYRDALVLYYRDQRSTRDVAAALGVSEAAALQRLARGRQYLADGVTDLVERSLRAPRTQRSLVALVLAALPAVPALAPSRAEAATRSHGGTMIKLALVVAALTAAGTTAYVVHQPGAQPLRPATTTESPTAPAASSAPAARPAVAAPAGPALPAQPRPTDPAAAAPGERPRLDSATIERIGLHRGPSRGPANAPVTIVAFSDLSCVHCGNVLGAIDQVLEEYPTRLRLVVKQFPVRPPGGLASEAALAADAQGKFWELHDLMLSYQDDLSHDKLVALAERAGLDVAAFGAALDQHKFAAAVDADKAAGRALGITATPTLYVNGKHLAGGEGPIGVEKLRSAVEQALAEL